MRRFRFVPFGERAPQGAIACDGLVEHAAIDASHWRGNKTPDELRAGDTSVEMALRLAEIDREQKHALVANNHFDTDGVLAVFCLLHPEIALAHREIVIGAAECGDFDEWPKDKRGLMLDIAIGKLAEMPSDRNNYERVLAELPSLVPNVTAREDLWGKRLDALERTKMDDVLVSSQGAIAIFHHRGEEKPGPILFRASPKDATRWLLAFEHDDGTFDYRYEMRRWSWADTSVRPPLKSPSRNAMAAALGKGFAIKGELGMSGLLRTERPIARPPSEIAEILARSDTTL